MVFEDKKFNFGTHVLMPCSQHSILECKINRSKIKRWKFIKESLQDYIKTIKQLDFEDSLDTFVSQEMSKHLAMTVKGFNQEINCNFGILHKVFKSGFVSPQTLKEILNFIVQWSLKITTLFSEPIDLLRAGKNECITLSQMQCCCLLTCAFLCVYPEREDVHRRYKTYPRINFTRLFHDDRNRGNFNSNSNESISSAKVEKLKCILHYFNRKMIDFGKNPSDKKLIFERRCLSSEQYIAWSQSNALLTNLTLESEGLIENADSALQVSFANMFIGGGTLGNGSVMEEIRFSICPELIVAQLFTEKLHDNEALVVYNAEQFSNYVGYGKSFTFAGNHMDNDNQLVRKIMSIDAADFSRGNSLEQFNEKWINRELNKCMTGFMNSSNKNLFSHQSSEIASGKWGCGIFKGDPELKAIIQLMAASVNKKSLTLYMMGDIQLQRSLIHLTDLLRTRKVTVGSLYQSVVNYNHEIILNRESTSFITIADYLCNCYRIEDKHNEPKIDKNIIIKKNVLDFFTKHPVASMIGMVVTGLVIAVLVNKPCVVYRK